MTDRIKELEAAAKAIDPASLEAAKAAITESCQEYIRWANLFFRRLETVEPCELNKFARALVLTMLGHLPTRPGTCPFCIQYGRDRSCQGCGFGATHGRCDDENSAFSRFIEAFQELGRVVYQDITAKDAAKEIEPNEENESSNESSCHPMNSKEPLFEFIVATTESARRMHEDLPTLSTMKLMEKKAAYLDHMISLIPRGLFSADVCERCRIVREALEDYW
jgi:hypothetical protein